MEKYSSNLRLILCCDNTSKIIAPIQSRCLLLRISAPEEDEVKKKKNKKIKIIILLKEKKKINK